MSRFGKFLRWLLVFVAICGVVWLAAVIWWQQTHRVVDEADVLLFIVLLPLALFGLVLLFWFGIRAIRRRRTAAAALLLAGPAAVTPTIAAAAEDPLRHARLDVHAIAMTTAGGDDSESLLAALLENTPLARPSATLFDIDGFRIPLVRIDALDTAPAEEWYEAYTKKLDPARRPVEHETERVQRCIALLAQTLDAAVIAIEPLLEPPPAPVAVKPVRPSAVVATPAVRPPATLRVILLIPEDFSEAARAALKAWLEPQLVQAVAASRAPVLLMLLPATAEAPPLALLDRFCTEVNGTLARDVLLLIGVDSLVDETTVRRLESAHVLRTATHPTGETPGEGAFAIALGGESSRAADREPLACLHRHASAQRARAPEARGKVSSAALRDAVPAAFARARATPDACASMVCDGDGFGPRGAEAAEAMTFSLDHLDAVADRVSTAAVLGQLGAASLPALLCIAVAQVGANGKASLVAPLSAPLDRHALLAVPAEPAASEPHPT